MSTASAEPTATERVLSAARRMKRRGLLGYVDGIPYYTAEELEEVALLALAGAVREAELKETIADLRIQLQRANIMARTNYGD